MGCGCGGKKGGVRGVGRRPIVTPRNRSISRGTPRSPRTLQRLEREAAAAPPANARQLSMKQNANKSETAQKRIQIERKRRLAIAARRK